MSFIILLHHSPIIYRYCPNNRIKPARDYIDCPINTQINRTQFTRQYRTGHVFSSKTKLLLDFQRRMIDNGGRKSIISRNR